MYIYIYIISIYILYIHTCICNHENNVSFQLSPQWFCGNSCTWVHFVLIGIHSMQG